MQHVFISYHHDDLDFAENVINRVEKAGYSTWTDDKLHAGEDWRAMIDIAIKNAFALVVIMTPEAKASEYVTYEWAFAWGVGVKVIPVMLRPTPLHPRLEAMQYLDFTNPKIRPWERLIEEIKAAAYAPLAHTINIPLNSPPYVRQAVMALDSPNEDDRVAAVRTLQRVGSSEAQTVLIEALQHPIDDVRRESAGALGEMGVTSAVSALIKLVHDPEVKVRLASVIALGRLGDITAVPALTEKLNAPSNDDWETLETTISLGKLGVVTVVPILLGMLSSPKFVGYLSYDDLTLSIILEIVGKLGDATALSELELLLAKNAYHTTPSGLEKNRAIQRAIKMIEQRIDEEKQRDASNL